MNRYVLLFIFIQISSAEKLCPHMVDRNLHGIENGEECWTFMHITPIPGESALKQAKKLCYEVFNGTVFPPTSDLSRLKRLKEILQGKSIVARSFITDNCLERHNSSSRVIKIKSVFGEESIPLNTNQSMISQMIVQLQNDRANACLVYHIPRRGEIYLQKAISCSQPSFDSVICISGILKHCYQQKGDGTCLCAADHPIYEGKFCAHETLECNEMNPCHNGGTCIKHEENGTYSCKCKSSKFSGEKCQKKDNPCANKQCSHGRCIVIFPDLPYCQCDSGYTGELCATGRCQSVREGLLCIQRNLQGKRQ
ncbi:EGF-like domain protein [Trichuris suis]|nr:EGF-like domain protein [Trichuris suis]